MDYFETLYTTAAELLLAEGYDVESKLLNPSNVQESVISHDNWNGGIDTYAIRIGITPSEYASLKKKKEIEKIEENITSALRESSKDDESIVIDRAQILPQAGVYSSTVLPFVNIDQSMWQTGYYRMFISHKVENKDTASNLKRALEQYGITGFVAHEDIKPTKEWLNTIKCALKTAHSLCAIITPDFIKSEWCDQEVGFALGREIFCIPIRKGIDPYGFFGELQGIQSKGKKVSEVAREIFTALFENRQSGYIEVVIELFLNSNSESNALKWINLLSTIKTFSKEQVRSIRDRYGDNPTLQTDEVMCVANELLKKYEIPVIGKSFFSTTVNDIDLPF